MVGRPQHPALILTAVARRRDDRSIAERIREALGSLGRELELGTPGGPGDLGPVFDRAVQSISGTLQRWDQGSGLRSFLGSPGRDLVARRGEWVQLSVRLGAVGQLGAERARFFLDDEPLELIPTRGEDLLEYAFPTAKSGVFRVEVELLRATGAVVSAKGATGASLLQVVDAGPVLGIDTELLLGSGARALQPLRQAAERGLELVYFDLGIDERTDRVREAIAEARLPAGAVLAYPLKSEEIETLGADFREVFATTRVRLLRSSGVPLVGLVVTDEFELETTEPEGLTLRTLSACAGELRAEHPFREETELAARFDDERSTRSSLAFRLDQATDSRLVPGNAVVFEPDNRRARERLFELIREARASIHLQFYILKASDFSERLAVELIRRARDGVSVRLIVDGLYSGERLLGRSNPLVRALEQEPNVEVAVGSPIASPGDFETVTLKRRDHRKVLVVDGRTAIVSGRNAGDEYFRAFDEVPVHDETPHERIPWLDAHVEVSGPLVYDVQQCFLDAWEECEAPEVLDRDAVLPELTPVGPEAARLVVHQGLLDAHGMAQYAAMLDAATRHVYIVNDFPVVASLASALSRAVARGVRVKLLTGNALARRMDDSFFPGPLHRELFEYMVKQSLEPLMRRGVEIFELVVSGLPQIVARGNGVRPYVHAKILTCDGEAASVGSANLDATASYWEHEANVVVENAAFAQRVEAEIEALMAGSLRLDPDSSYWSREGTQRAIVSRLWPEGVFS